MVYWLKPFTFLLFSLVFSQLTFAEMNRLDSLKNAVELMPEDSLKCETFIEISLLLYSGSEAVSHAEKALSLSKKINDPSLTGKAYYALSWTLSFDDVKNKKIYLDSATEIFTKTKDLNGLGLTHNAKATIFLEYGSFNDAMESYKKAYHCYVQLDEKYKLSIMLSNWAICLNSTQKPLEAIEKCTQSLEYCQSERPDAYLQFSRVYNVMAESYAQIGDLEMASQYHMKAFLNRKKVKSQSVVESLLNMSTMIIDAINQKKDTTGLMNEFNSLGFTSLASLIDSAASFPDILNHPGYKYQILKTRKKLYLLDGNFFEAYNTLTELNKMDAEQKLSSSSLEAFADLKVLYDKEQLKIKLLEEKVLIQKKNTQVNFLLLALLLVTALLIISFQIYRGRIRKSKIVLIEAKQEQQIISMRSMLEGQEKERTRIARDLHDGLGNLLSSVKASISSLHAEFKTDNINTIFCATSEMIDEACSEVRKIAHEMMPQALNKLGLIKALEDLILKANHTYPFKASFQVYGEEKLLEDNANVMLFRIVQELINNIIKYAEADEVLLQLTYSNEWLNLTIEDNGIGFETNEVSVQKGMGLKSIAFRTNYVGGNYEIDSRKGSGTLVSINVPLNKY